MRMCCTRSVCGRMAVHLPDSFADSVERTWKSQERKHHSKLSGTEMTKKNVSSFQMSWQYHKDVHLCNNPRIMQVAGFLGPFIVPRGHSQGCWRCQKVSEEIEDIQWYSMMCRYQETECEKCWISMALYLQCLQLAGTWTGRLWDQIRPGHWRRGLFIPNAWSCLCKHKGQIPNGRIMRKPEVLQKHRCPTFREKGALRLKCFMVLRYIIYHSIVFHYVPLVRICFNQSFSNSL